MRCKGEGGQICTCEPLVCLLATRTTKSSRKFGNVRQDDIRSACPHANEMLAAVAPTSFPKDGAFSLDGERTKLFLIPARRFEPRT